MSAAAPRPCSCCAGAGDPAGWQGQPCKLCRGNLLTGKQMLPPCQHHSNGAMSTVMEPPTGHLHMDILGTAQEPALDISRSILSCHSASVKPPCRSFFQNPLRSWGILHTDASSEQVPACAFSVPCPCLCSETSTKSKTSHQWKTALEHLLGSARTDLRAEEGLCRLGLIRGCQRGLAAQEQTCSRPGLQPLSASEIQPESNSYVFKGDY